MALELVPLCTVQIQLKPPIQIGMGPAGTRVIFEVATGLLQGDRLRGEYLGTDWLVVGPEGTGSLDVRAKVQTEDGATIFTHYSGRADLSRGLDPPVTIYVAPRFETGDERYAWLNRIQAIGKGTVHEDLSIDFEWHEVR